MQQVKAGGRVKLWLGAALIGSLILAALNAWPGSDDDAVHRNQRDGDRIQEASVSAFYSTTPGRTWTVRWGKRGALTISENPKTPFDRVVQVQRGDTVVVEVNTSTDRGALSCSVRVNGRKYPGVVFENRQCTARAVVN